ncbi:MAG: FtsX-like permease family protein [Lysobacterales bacterium]
MSAPAQARRTTNLRLAWRLLRREQRSGELTLIMLAVGLAMLAITAVGALTGRVEVAMQLAANRLQGGDLVLRAATPIDAAIDASAAERGLRHGRTVTFPSMLRREGQFRLIELKGVDEGFPLVGQYRLTDGREVAHGPPAGSVWIGQRLARGMQLAAGEQIELGQSKLRIDGIYSDEPDAVFDYATGADRVIIAMAELPATGLVQEGARAQWRALYAGPAAAIADFRNWLTPRLERGQRLQDSSEGRPELRQALDRASRFFRLAAVLASVLAGVAVALAARRHADRHLDGYAVLRCLGASQGQLLRLTLLQLAGVIVQAALWSLPLAWLLQALAARLAEPGLGVSLPPAPLSTLLPGLVTGIVVLYAFALPPLLRLARVPTLRVLRRELSAPPLSWWLHAGTGLAAAVGLLAWQAGEAKLLGSTLIALLALVAALAVLGALLLQTGGWWVGRSGGALRIALAGLRRRRWATLGQIIALGLGLGALALLILLRTQLIDRWQANLPVDAPNRFLIGLQDAQRDDFQTQLAASGIASPGLYPMVRGRLVSRNGTAVDFAQYGEGRARRLAEREFNLSHADQLNSGNRIVAGRDWSDPALPAQALSVEQGFAESLGWQIGDRIGFEIGGEPVEGEIVNLREVDWDSFQPNFFVVFKPQALRDFPASWITSLHVAPGQEAAESALLEAFPNITLIDVSALLQQVRRTAEQAALAIQAVFLFTLAAGLLVLVAAIRATADERLREGALLRALGARSRQLTLARSVEFGLLGAVAGAAAAIAAGLATAWLGRELFELPFTLDWGTTLLLALVTGTLVAGLGLWSTRRVVRVPPLLVLRAE